MLTFPFPARSLTLFCLFLCASLPAANLLKNPEFASADGILPDGWRRVQNIAFPAAFQTRKGIVRISENSPAYNNMVSQHLELDTAKSYYFEVEYQSDFLSWPGGVSYSWVDAQGRNLHEPKFILKTQDRQTSWKKVQAVLSCPDPSKAFGIKIYLVNYSRGQSGDRPIFFRRPVLCDYQLRETVFFSGDGIEPTGIFDAVDAKAMNTLPKILFTHNMTNTPAGIPYKLEKGEVGFLRLDTGRIKSEQLEIQVETPPGVSIELYFFNSGKGFLEQEHPAKQTSGRSEFAARRRNWLVWSNSLLFAADATVPKEFSIRVELRDVDSQQTWQHEIPIRQVQGKHSGQYRKPQKFAYDSYQNFPVRRIDYTGGAGPLAVRLRDNWLRSGWRETPFFNITHYLSLRLSENSSFQGIYAVAETAAGAPGPLYCNQAIIDGGVERMQQYLLDRKIEEKLRSTEQIHYDFEPYVTGPVTLTCFCAVCRKVFAESCRLDPVPSAEQILQSHEADWVRFRCQQRASAVKTMVQAIKRIAPEAVFLFCSMPLPPQPEKAAAYYREFGIDLKLYDDFIDVHTPMNYGATLDFFRSLEQEAQFLRKPRQTIVSNGWGLAIADINVQQRANQLFAAFFCDNYYPSIGQGLFVAQGDLIAAIKDMMTIVADTEARWTQGKLQLVDKTPVLPGFQAENQLYSFERRALDGRKWLLLFNTHPKNTIYGKIAHDSSMPHVYDLMQQKRLLADNGIITLALPPVSCRLFEFNPTEVFPQWASEDSTEVLAAEKAALTEQQKLFQTIRRDGFTYQRDSETCTVSTSNQELVFHLTQNAEASWEVSGKAVLAGSGRLGFLDRGAFPLQKLHASPSAYEFQKDSLQLTFSSKVEQAPYDGLLIQQTWTIYKDRPELTYEVALIPEGGFRPFRLRNTHILTIGCEQTSREPYAARIEYQIGAIKEHTFRTVNFVRQDEKFPDGEAFFTRYAKEQFPLQGNSFIARDTLSGAQIQIESKGVAQIFAWRDKHSATLETIYADAYPSNDPHLIKTWTSRTHFIYQAAP